MKSWLKNFIGNKEIELNSGIEENLTPNKNDEYKTRLEQEIENYNEVENIHDLPECFHYISNKYLCQIIEDVTGFSNFRDFFIDEINQCSSQSDDIIRIASIGSGNSDEELTLCQQLACSHKVIFDCYELNPSLLEIASQKAKSLNIEMRFFQQDFNEINFVTTYDAFFANHSLHHVVNLEGLFQAIHQAGKHGYFFLINDMIGRNGHMSWSKAQDFLESYWMTLPERLKWNVFFEKYDLELPNFDCSQEGFEGIRAQDILPLLIDNYQFEVFVPFFSCINRIIDRVYGHNYNIDSNNPNNDIALLEHLWYMDELFLQTKYLPPTQMIAKVVDPRIEIKQFKSRIYQNPKEALKMR